MVKFLQVCLSNFRGGGGTPSTKHGDWFGRHNKYAADGMPLAFTQENFLVKNCNNYEKVNITLRDGKDTNLR